MSMSQYVDAWEAPMLVMVDGVRDAAQEVAGKYGLGNFNSNGQKNNRLYFFQSFIKLFFAFSIV